MAMLWITGMNLLKPRTLNKALNLNRIRLAVYYEMGVAYYSKENYTAAADSYAKSIKADSEILKI